MRLYIWKIEREEGCGYDEFDAAIVVARTEAEARKIHPAGHLTYGWVHDTDALTVTKLGTAASGIEAGTVLLASFNAG